MRIPIVQEVVLLVHGFRHARPQALLSGATSWRSVRLAVLASAVLLQGCAVTPPVPRAGADAADPAAPVAPAAYRSTLGAYERQRPAEPRPWGEQNQRVTPRSGQ